MGLQRFLERQCAVRKRNLDTGIVQRPLDGRNSFATTAVKVDPEYRVPDRIRDADDVQRCVRVGGGGTWACLALTVGATKRLEITQYKHVLACARARTAL